MADTDQLHFRKFAFVLRLCGLPLKPTDVGKAMGRGPYNTTVRNWLLGSRPHERPLTKALAYLLRSERAAKLGGVKAKTLALWIIEDGALKPPELPEFDDAADPTIATPQALEQAVAILRAAGDIIEHRSRSAGTSSSPRTVAA